MAHIAYLWDAERQLLAETTAEDAEPRLLVADSWLVEDGRARAISLHRDRFFYTASTWYSQSELDAYWNAALDALPTTGRWVPRVEAREGADTGCHHLGLRVRSAPATNRLLVLATHHGPDPRTSPAVKGPDIPALHATRAHVAPGVDDVVILDERGHIVDGATTAILWWRGGTLMSPPADMTRVDSVTAKTIRLLAAQAGIPCAVERAHVGDLAGCRVWAVNALHGIRTVSAWLDGPDLAIDDADDDRWIRSLAVLQRPIC